MDIGAWDWGAPDYVAALFPEDVPQEWRAGLYSGLLRCVALPAERWRAAGVEGWAAWAEEVPPNFGFYLEQGEADAAELTAVAAALGPLLHGVLLHPAAPKPDGLAPSQALWPKTLSAADPLHTVLHAVGARVWAPQEPADRALEAISAADSRATAEFQGEIMDNAQSLLQGYACLGLCCLPALDQAEVWSPLRLRQMLEASAALQLCAMVVEPGPEALTALRQLDTLAGLLGL